VLEWSNGEGYVRAQGDRWHARGDIAVEPGDKVEIKQIEGLTLIVGAVESARNSG